MLDIEFVPIAVLQCPSFKYVIAFVPRAILFVESTPVVVAILDNAFVDIAKLFANNKLLYTGGVTVLNIGSVMPAYNEYIWLLVEYCPKIILFLGLSIKKSKLLERLFVLVL